MKEIWNVGDTITKTDVQEISDAIFNLKKTILYRYEFKEGDKVFFDKNCKISRTNFKTSYPKVKVVYKVEEADIHVIRDNGEIHFYLYIGWNQTQREIHERDIIILNQAIGRLKKDEVLLEEKSIKCKGDKIGKMTGEELALIRKLTSSNDQSSYQLGITLLYEWDFDDNIDEYMLSLSGGNQSHFYNIKSKRKYNTIIKQLQTKFPTRIL